MKSKHVTAFQTAFGNMLQEITQGSNLAEKAQILAEKAKVPVEHLQRFLDGTAVTSQKYINLLESQVITLGNKKKIPKVVARLRSALGAVTERRRKKANVERIDVPKIDTSETEKTPYSPASAAGIVELVRFLVGDAGYKYAELAEKLSLQEGDISTILSGGQVVEASEVEAIYQALVGLVEAYNKAQANEQEATRKFVINDEPSSDVLRDTDKPVLIKPTEGESLGAFLKRLRGKRAQKELAQAVREKLGLDETFNADSVSYFEREVCIPSTECVLAIAEICGGDVSQLDDMHGKLIAAFQARKASATSAQIWFGTTIVLALYENEVLLPTLAQEAEIPTRTLIRLIKADDSAELEEAVVKRLAATIVLEPNKKLIEFFPFMQEDEPQAPEHNDTVEQEAEAVQQDEEGSQPDDEIETKSQLQLTQELLQRHGIAKLTKEVDADPRTVFCNEATLRQAVCQLLLLVLVDIKKGRSNLALFLAAKCAIQALECVVRSAHSDCAEAKFYGLIREEVRDIQDRFDRVLGWLALDVTYADMDVLSALPQQACDQAEKLAGLLDQESKVGMDFKLEKAVFEYAKAVVKYYKAEDAENKIQEAGSRLVETLL